MDVRDLIGKRILVRSGSRAGGFASNSVDEVRVLEVSPSGQWTKLMNQCGNKFWKPTADIAMLETLTELRSEPKPE